MSFEGVIPASFKATLREVVRDWPKGIDVYNLCSGNLTVERLLHQSGMDFKIHGCDVTMYSCHLGCYAAGTPLPLVLKPEHEERFQWLAPYLDTDLRALATLVLMYSYARPLVNPNNAQYRRLHDGIRAQWDKMHGKTVEDLEGRMPKLESFFCGDAFEYIDAIPKDAAVITYPPFSGAENWFVAKNRGITTLFQWEPPEFKDMTSESLGEFWLKVSDRKYWAFGRDGEKALSNLSHNVVLHNKTTNRANVIRMYSGRGTRRLVMPQQDLDFLKVPHLGPGDTIGAKMHISPLNAGQFSAIRSQYMAKGIKPGQAMMPLAVFVDGILVGVFAMNPSKFRVLKRDDFDVYMLSDFPVAPTSYPRLSKLVLYAALSNESRALCEKMCRCKIEYVTTTAFTDNPISMKYRGLFNLVSRKETEGWKLQQAGKTPDDSYYAQRYELNYQAQFGGWTLNEGLELWRKKHGKVADPSAPRRKTGTDGKEST